MSQWHCWVPVTRGRQYGRLAGPQAKKFQPSHVLTWTGQDVGVVLIRAQQSHQFRRLHVFHREQADVILEGRGATVMLHSPHFQLSVKRTGADLNGEESAPHSPGQHHQQADPFLLFPSQALVSRQDPCQGQPGAQTNCPSKTLTNQAQTQLTQI